MQVLTHYFSLLCLEYLLDHRSDLAQRQRGKAGAEILQVDIQYLEHQHLGPENDLVPAEELDYVVLVAVYLH